MTSDYYSNYADAAGWNWLDDPSRDDYFNRLSLAAGMPHQAVVVEVGFGDGHFLRWAHRNGHQPFGYELIASLVERANASGIRASQIPIDASNHPGGVDVIAAFDVLEHMTISQIEAFLKDGKALLKPAGFFLLRFPNSASPLGSIYQGNDVTHITPLSAYCLDQIAAIVGLPGSRPLRVRPYPRHFLPKVRRWIAYLMQDGIEGLLSLAYQAGRSHDLGPNTLILINRGE